MKKLIVTALIGLLVFVSCYAETAEEPKQYDPWFPIGLGSIIPSVESVLEREVETTMYASDTFFNGHAYEITNDDFYTYLKAIDESDNIESRRFYTFRFFFDCSDGSTIFIEHWEEDNAFSISVYPPN